MAEIGLTLKAKHYWLHFALSIDIILFSISSANQRGFKQYCA